MYTSLILLIIILVPVPVMVKYMLSGKNPYGTIREGATATAIAIMLVFIISGIFMGGSLFTRIDMILSSISTNEMVFPKGYEELVISQLSPEELEKALEASKEVIKMSIPAVAVILTILSSYLHYLWISVLLHKSGKKVNLLPPFREFSLPKNFLLGTIIVYGLSYISGSLGIVDQRLIMINVEMIFGFLFAMQGLAFLFFYGKMKRVHKLLLLVISAIFLVTTFGHTILFLLGLTDIAFDLRKRISQNFLKIK